MRLSEVSDRLHQRNLDFLFRCAVNGLELNDSVARERLASAKTGRAKPSATQNYSCNAKLRTLDVTHQTAIAVPLERESGELHNTPYARNLRIVSRAQRGF